MNWFTKLFSSPFFKKLVEIFKYVTAAENVNKALELVGQALPYIKIAGDIMTSLTPTAADDLVWAALKHKYPLLFDGKTHTPEEIKNMSLLYATEALEQKFNLSTTLARTAAQLAYNKYQAMPEEERMALSLDVEAA